MYIYAFGDIHGRFSAFNQALDIIDLNGSNKLVLLGNFIGEGCGNSAVLKKIMALEKQYGKKKIIVILGGKEVAAINNDSPGFYKDNKRYLSWLKKHRLYSINNGFIFYNNDVYNEVAKELAKKSDESIREPNHTFGIPVISHNEIIQELIHENMLTEKESQCFDLPEILEIKDSVYYINSKPKPCNILTVLRYNEDMSHCFEYRKKSKRHIEHDNEKGFERVPTPFTLLLFAHQQMKIREHQRENFENYRLSEYYFDVTETIEQELVPLAENVFEKGFDINLIRMANINLNYLLLCGADEEILKQFEAGKVNCVYPKGGKSIENHERYKKALEVFYNLYESERGKKPLVYLCVPNGNFLNLLYIDVEEDWSEYCVNSYGGKYIIKSFVINNLVSPDDLTGNEKLKDFGDFAEINYKINQNGLIYRVSELV
ncbi:MAG: metallophosphoesterase [Oscillospiraceae bacterium]|nr:metallophosphoesterase [Oscillospiraceae bacterium]